MTKISFVRHGETEWNALGKIQGQTDIPLNKKGIQQAKECGVFVGQSPWDVLITSPLKRAKQTAEEINQHIKLDIIDMAEFMEKYFGDAEGMTKEDRLKKYPDRNYLNQEETTDLISRVMAGIHKIHNNHQGLNVLVVAHGGVINAILAELSVGKVSEKTELINGGITTISMRQNQWIIEQINYIDHLSRFSGKGNFNRNSI